MAYIWVQGTGQGLNSRSHWKTRVWLKQNLSPKDSEGDIMKLKVSWWIYLLWALKN